MTSQEAELKRDIARAQLACALVSYALGESAPLDHETRGRRVAFARQVAMYLMHIGFGMSLGRVAGAFGRDRSTASYACHRVEDARDDPGFDTLIDNLEEALRRTPAPGERLQ